MNIDYYIAQYAEYMVMNKFFLVPITVGMGSALITCVLIDIFHRERRALAQRERHRHVMSASKARMRWVMRHFATLVTCGIEESRVKDKLTDDECAYLYQLVGSKLNLMDLLPKAPYTANFKADTGELKEKLEKKWKKKQGAKISDALSIRKS